MQKTLLTLSIFIITSITFGQEKDTRTNDQLAINLIVPSLDFEVSTGTNSTIDLKLGTAFGYSKSGDESDFGIFPVFQSEYRYYYNFKKRAEKGKKTSENSANYLTLIANIRGGNSVIGDLDLTEDFGVFVGPAWGLQRVYNSGIKLNLALGAGYGTNDLGDSYFSPFIAIQLGWLVAK